MLTKYSCMIHGRIDINRKHQSLLILITAVQGSSNEEMYVIHEAKYHIVPIRKVGHQNNMI